jgi:hypothetical protein
VTINPNDPTTWDGIAHGDEYDVYINAMTGKGDRAYDWEDKPHRLVYDLVTEARRLRDERDGADAVNRRWDQDWYDDVSVEDGETWVWVDVHGQRPMEPMTQPEIDAVARIASDPTGRAFEAAEKYLGDLDQRLGIPKEKR